VLCKLWLHFELKPRKGRPLQKTFKLDKVQSAAVKADFQAGLRAKLGNDSYPDDSSPKALWVKLKSAILETSENIMGLNTKKNKDWFNKNNHKIQGLLANKRSVHQAQLAQPSCPVRKAAFRRFCSNLQRKLRDIQNKWWINLAKRTRHSADADDFRGFYEALKAVYGPAQQIQSPLHSADRFALLTDKMSILSRWSDHFQTLFSADRVVQDSAILSIPQLPVKVELD